MSNPDNAVTNVRLVEDPAQLSALGADLEGVELIAVDLEANGFHAYKAKLCVIQLAWQHDEDTFEIAIVDPLAVDVGPLANVFGEQGPMKILHDVSYDARLLKQAGLPLVNVYDTALCASFLGENATGLANLLSARFGLTLSKALQRHDWAKRPFSQAHLDYLTGDVRYLLDLQMQLFTEAEQAGITEAVMLETEFRLASARNSSEASTPPHARIKGYGKLDLVGQAILRRLVLARDQLAEKADIPLGNICPNKLLLELAQRRPKDPHAARRLCGGRRAAARHARTWHTAITQGMDDKEPPLEEQEMLQAPRVTKAEREARKTLHRRVTKWRNAHATKAKLDPQVILPGHCVGMVTSALYASTESRQSFVEALKGIAGFGTFRVDLYGRELYGLRQAD